jgi:catechol 2,3-dioxygenase-like lactoylglutathione lyase family enzyme
LCMKAYMSTEQGLKNPEFELRGIDHLALVCSDMKRTIAFYGDVLGMSLLEDIELPDGTGHHFIFDIGKGALLAFFWFGNERKGTPTAATPHRRVRGRNNRHDLSAANCSICHVAFDVPAEKIDDYLKRLRVKGVPATVVNYDHWPHQWSETVTENTIGRSIYFTDPDGVVLEFATKSPAASGRVRIVGAGSEAQRSPRKPLAASAGL